MGQRIMFWSTHTYIKIQNQTHPLHIKMLQCSKWSSRFNWPWKDLRAAVLQVVGGARVWVLKDDCLILSVNVQDVANHGFWVISLDHFRPCIFLISNFDPSYMMHCSNWQHLLHPWGAGVLWPWGWDVDYTRFGTTSCHKVRSTVHICSKWISSAARLTLQDFEKRLNFDFGQLRKCINEVGDTRLANCSTPEGSLVWSFLVQGSYAINICDWRPIWGCLKIGYPQHLIS